MLYYQIYKYILFFFFFKQKTAYEIWRDWSSDVCSSDLRPRGAGTSPGARVPGGNGERPEPAFQFRPPAADRRHGPAPASHIGRAASTEAADAGRRVEPVLGAIPGRGRRQRRRGNELRFQRADEPARGAEGPWHGEEAEDVERPRPALRAGVLPRQEDAQRGVTPPPQRVLDHRRPGDPREQVVARLLLLRRQPLDPRDLVV